MKSVYLESTIISYLAANRSRDLIKAAHQEISWEWWAKRRPDYRLYVSEVVIDEIGAGDIDVARRRLELVEGIELLVLTESARQLTKRLVSRKSLPSKAVHDALHLSLAAIHGIDFLLTWNCRHLANAELRATFGQVIKENGYKCPEICTPDQLLGEWACI
jgi:hypothetical protein